MTEADAWMAAMQYRFVRSNTGCTRIVSQTECRPPAQSSGIRVALPEPPESTQSRHSIRSGNATFQPTVEVVRSFTQVRSAPAWRSLSRLPMRDNIVLGHTLRQHL